VYWNEDGSLRVAGRLNAEDGALLLTALTAAAEGVEAGRPARSTVERPAANHEAAGSASSAVGPCATREALVELARAFLDPDPDRQSAAARHQVVVHVDADALAVDTAAGAAYLDGGPALSAEQVARIGCDASLVVLLRRGREVLDIGRASRSTPSAVNRALWTRDGGCRFPGCEEHRRSRVQGHHIRYWSRGGRTALSNLVLFCGYHHRLIHQAQFSVRVGPCGELAFRDPQGRQLREHAAAAVLAWVAPSALPPAEEELLPLWAGEKLDLDYAVSVLLDWRAYRANRVRGDEAAAAA